MLNNDQCDNTTYHIDLYKKKSAGSLNTNSKGAGSPKFKSKSNVNTRSTIKNICAGSLIDKNVNNSANNNEKLKSFIKNLYADSLTNTDVNIRICNNNIDAGSSVNNVNSKLNNNDSSANNVNTRSIDNNINSGSSVNNVNNDTSQTWTMSTLPKIQMVPCKKSTSHFNISNPLVDRINVHYAKLRLLSPPKINNINLNDNESLLANSSKKLDTGYYKSLVQDVPIPEPVESITKFPPPLRINRNIGPGRPIGSKNKTEEEKEQERLNKKPRGRPLGSGNKKSTNKKDREVIIYDNEVALRTNPNKFEVHLIQYTLANPHVSYAEWNHYAEKIFNRANNEGRASSRQYLNEWEENTTREINRIKGKLSLSRLKDKGKILYEPEDESARETMNYKYELLETRKDDPFFINLLKRSFEIKSSRKSRIDNIPCSSTSSSSYNYNPPNFKSSNTAVNNLLDSDNDYFCDNVLEFTNSSNVNDNYEKDLIDLTDSYADFVDNIPEGFNVNDILEKDTDDDVIDRLLNELHDEYNNEIKKNDENLKNIMIIYLMACQSIYNKM